MVCSRTGRKEEVAGDLSAGLASNWTALCRVIVRVFFSYDAARLGSSILGILELPGCFVLFTKD